MTVINIDGIATGSTITAADISALVNKIQEGSDTDVLINAAGSITTKKGFVCSGANIAWNAEYSNGNVSGTAFVYWNKGNKQSITVSGAACNITFTAPDGPCNLLLKCISGTHAGSFLGVKWVNGSGPTLTTTGSSVDIVSFYYDGTNYYGVDSLKFY